MWNAVLHAPLSDLLQINIIAVAILLFLAYALIAYGPLGKLYKEREPVPTGMTVRFAVACITLYLSFGGPLDYLSDNYLYSVHMFQHMVEIIIMTPLFIYSTPFWMVKPLWDFRASRVIINGWLNPFIASIVYNGILNLFHIPAIYDYALNNDSFHLFEHFCFFIGAVFFWIGYRRLTPGKRLLYLLLNYNLMMPLVIFMIVAPHPWYLYYVHQPRLYAWLSPLADQQVGAIIMAISMMGSYVVTGVRDYSRQDQSFWYE